MRACKHNCVTSSPPPPTKVNPLQQPDEEEPYRTVAERFKELADRSLVEKILVELQKCTKDENAAICKVAFHTFVALFPLFDATWKGKVLDEIEALVSHQMAYVRSLVAEQLKTLFLNIDDSDNDSQNRVLEMLFKLLMDEDAETGIRTCTTFSALFPQLKKKAHAQQVVNMLQQYVEKREEDEDPPTGALSLLVRYFSYLGDPWPQKLINMLEKHLENQYWVTRLLVASALKALLPQLNEEGQQKQVFCMLQKHADDENEGVRKKCLSALAGFFPQCQHTKDEDEGVQKTGHSTVVAFFSPPTFAESSAESPSLLAAKKRQKETLNILEQRANDDANQFVRAHALSILAELFPKLDDEKESKKQVLDTLIRRAKLDKELNACTAAFLALKEICAHLDEEEHALVLDMLLEHGIKNESSGYPLTCAFSLLKALFPKLNKEMKKRVRIALLKCIKANGMKRTSESYCTFSQLFPGDVDNIDAAFKELGNLDIDPQGSRLARS